MWWSGPTTSATGEVERTLDELQEAGWQIDNFQVDRDLW